MLDRTSISIALVAFGALVDYSLNTPSLLNQLIERVNDLFHSTPKELSQYQKFLHSKIESTSCKDHLLSNGEDQHTIIEKVIQEFIVPLYRLPMPENPLYRNQKGKLVELFPVVKLGPIRYGHGALHAVRTALWSQLLIQLYKALGRQRIEHPILLSISAALHDAGREYEGPDYWHEQSVELLHAFFKKTNIAPHIALQYVQALRKKDLKTSFFSTDIQRILHDADCLEMMRMYGRSGFDQTELHFLRFKSNSLTEQFINEAAAFIKLSEQQELRTHLEISSKNIYRDLMNLLKERASEFPTINALLSIYAPETILKEYAKTGLVVRMLASTSERSLNFEIKERPFHFISELKKDESDRLRSATYIKNGHFIDLPLSVGLLFRIESLVIAHAFKKNAQTSLCYKSLPLKRVFSFKKGLSGFLTPKLKYTGMTGETFTDYRTLEALGSKIAQKSGQLIERNEVLFQTKTSRSSPIVGLVVLKNSLEKMSPAQKNNLIAIKDRFLPERAIYIYNKGSLQELKRER